MKLTPDQVVERDTLIFGRPLNWDKAFGGIERFDSLTHETLTLLVAKGYADLGEQNDAPTVAEFLDFMIKYPHTEANGYVVSPTRDDCRVSLEGCICPQDFVTLKC